MKASCLLLALAIACVSKLATAQETLQDFASNGPAGSNYTVLSSLVSEADPEIAQFVNSTDAQGVLFAPSDAAFVKLLTALGFPDASFLTRDFVDALLRDHVVEAQVSGSDEEANFTSLGGQQLNVTFTGSDIFSVQPVNAVSLSFPQISLVDTDTPKYATASGNATVYFVDAVLATNSTITAFIDKAALSFYNAVDKVIGETESRELSEFKALLDLDSEVKEVLSNTELQANGTLLAPSNAAVQALYKALNFGNYPSDLNSTSGLRALTKNVLLYHYVPAELWPSPDSPPTADSVYGPFATALDEARKLTFSVDTNGTVVVSDQELANDNVNVTSVDIKIVTDDGYAPTTETLAGKLHIIDGVLLPTVEMLTLKDFADAAPSGQEFENATAAIRSLDSASLAVYGPALKGAMFLPSNAAFTTFVESLAQEGLTTERFTSNPSLVRRVLYEHTIFDEEVSADKNTTYATWVGEIDTSDDTFISLSFGEDGMPTSFERLNGSASGQENTSTVLASYGPNALGGYIHFVDAVVVSEATLDLVKNLNSPAGTQWKDLAPGGAEAYKEVTDILESIGLGGLFEEEGSFTLFLPNDAALRTLASDMDVEFEQLKGQGPVLKKIIESYIVNEEEYAGDDGLTEGERYMTRSGDVWLEKTTDGISLFDEEGSNRKLLASPSSGFAGDDVAFFDGKHLFYISSAPISPKREAELQAALDSAAQMATISAVAAVISAIAAFVFL